VDIGYKGRSEHPRGLMCVSASVSWRSHTLQHKTQHEFTFRGCEVIHSVPLPVGYKFKTAYDPTNSPHVRRILTFQIPTMVISPTPLSVSPFSALACSKSERYGVLLSVDGFSGAYRRIIAVLLKREPRRIATRLKRNNGKEKKMFACIVAHDVVFLDWRSRTWCGGNVQLGLGDEKHLRPHQQNSSEGPLPGPKRLGGIEVRSSWPAYVAAGQKFSCRVPRCGPTWVARGWARRESKLSVQNFPCYPQDYIHGSFGVSPYQWPGFVDAWGQCRTRRPRPP
jgi:hypothetical protein